MADETPAPLSDADLEMVRDTYAHVTRKPQDDWQLADVSAAAACAVLYIPRLLATIAALQRQVDAAHLDVAYQVTTADTHAHHLHEADAARDRQIDDLTHERDQLLHEREALRAKVAALLGTSPQQPAE